jgi:hypothetical protein
LPFLGHIIALLDEPISDHETDPLPGLIRASCTNRGDGPVRIEDVYNTRVKECDRLEACSVSERGAIPHGDPG